MNGGCKGHDSWALKGRVMRPSREVEEILSGAHCEIGFGRVAIAAASATKRSRPQALSFW